MYLPTHRTLYAWGLLIFFITIFIWFFFFLTGMSSSHQDSKWWSQLEYFHRMETAWNEITQNWRLNYIYHIKSQCSIKITMYHEKVYLFRKFVLHICLSHTMKTSRGQKCRWLWLPPGGLIVAILRCRSQCNFNSIYFLSMVNLFCLIIMNA